MHTRLRFSASPALVLVLWLGSVCAGAANLPKAPHLDHRAARQAAEADPLLHADGRHGTAGPARRPDRTAAAATPGLVRGVPVEPRSTPFAPPAGATPATTQPGRWATIPAGLMVAGWVALRRRPGA